MIKVNGRFLLISGYLLFLLSNPALSQNYPVSFQHLSIENGLSDNTVNCIIQDAEGFVWIGTSDGLNKYYGNKVKVLRHTDGDSTSISSNYTDCAFKDSKNRLWFGGYGLSLLNQGSKKFINFLNKKNDPGSIGNNDITAITEDENGNIWVGTRLGLFRFNESIKTFSRFFHDSVGAISEIYYKNRIIDLVPDKQGNLWVATINGLYKFSLTTHLFTSYCHNPKNKKSLPGNLIRSLAMAPGNKLWMAIADSGLSVYDIKQNQFTAINTGTKNQQLISNQIKKIFCDTEGKIWMVSAFNGVIIFNPETKEWKNFVHDDFNAESLADNKTNTIFKDLSGMMWIGLERRGVDRISPYPDKFITYKPQPGKANSLCEGDITAVAEDKERNLWLGSKNGLMYFDRKYNSFKCFRHQGTNSNFLSSDIVYSLATDAQNNLWAATDYGLNYFNTTTNKWTKYFNNKNDVNSLPSNVVFDVAVKSNGVVWIGTAGGIARFNPIKKNFYNRYNNSAIEKYTPAYYTVIFEDSRRTLWFSTSRGGIINIDDSFRVLHLYRQSGGFNASTVHQFVEDASGDIWLATDKGLYKWKRKTETFLSYNNKEGNLYGDIKSVVIENKNTVWISSSNGLTQLIFDDKETITSAKTFNASDGLQSNAFNSYAGKKLSSGEILFGGINGFNIFYPENISYNKFIPPVQLSSFRVLDKEFDIQNLSGYLPKIQLSYKENFFSFEMAALSYDHPEKNQFAYQLEGFDKEMIYCGASHTVAYTNVPPGKYTLHIIASNNDGLWNRDGIRISMIIVPPFWKTLQFRSLVAISLALLAYLFFQLRIRKLKNEEKKRSEINKQIAEARLTALSAQMNPHFIFNSLNSIQQFIAVSEKDNALKYLSKFSKLIRLVLQNAGKNSNSIADELDILTFYLELEALRFSNKFSWHFSVDSKLNKDRTGIPSMLLQPFVENAVLHGLLNKDSRGHLEITIAATDNRLICTIEDNGIGRAAAIVIKNNKLLSHESLGMKLTDERMQMLGKIENKKINIRVYDLNNENNKATGTKVEIEIADIKG